MRHKNPYRIHDPNNIFEVAENSSHPELFDKRRIYKYRGRTFKSAVEAQTYLEDHGIDWRQCKLTPVRHLDGDGSCVIFCHIIDRDGRLPQGQYDIRDLERLG